MLVHQDISQYLIIFWDTSLDGMGRVAYSLVFQTALLAPRKRVSEQFVLPSLWVSN